MNQPPFITVIVPTYQDWDRLELCLKALKAQSYPSDQFEVLVVNNHPEDLPDYKVEVGNVRLLEEAKPGSYAARNAAIKVAKGEIFAFTDSDCIPSTTWLEEAIRFLKNDYDRIAGKVVLNFQSSHLTWAELYESVFAFPQDMYVEMGFGATANMVAKRHCFDRVGLFDASLLSGGDFDWGKRANQVGLSIGYATSAIVAHPARKTFSSLLKKKLRVSAGHLQIKNESYGKIFISIIRSFFLPIGGLDFQKTVKNLEYISSVKVILLIAALNLITSFFKLFLKMRLVKSSKL
jgi:GT2 family glycosyltransferase